MTFFGKNNIYNNTTIDAVPVTTTSTEMIANNSARTYCALINTGNKDVWMNVGAPAIANKGIFLGRNGGSYEIDQTKLNTKAINGITAVGTSTISFLEGDVV